MGTKIFLLPYVLALLLVHCWVTLAVSLINTTDESALLAFKAHITLDPHKLLVSNWSKTTSYCKWIGVYCNSPQKRVTALNLSSMDLEGTLPPQLGNLSFLISLDLSYNNFFGHLPDEIGKLQNLQMLYADNNRLSGLIPPTLAECRELLELKLGSNSLTGSIPQSIGNQTKLQVLNLRSNHYLTGQIPPEIFNISSLRTFDIFNNSMFGTLPTCICVCHNLPALENIKLARNQLKGEIPSSLAFCKALQVLSLSFNQFTGSIPRGIGNLSELQELYLGLNKLGGGIPTEMGNLANLQVLSLPISQLTGPIPVEIFSISTLQIIDLSNNSLYGTLPMDAFNHLSKLQMLFLFYNQLSGQIPSSLSSCGELELLELSDNRFTGSIPSELGNLSSLEQLLLNSNSLTGMIPVTFGNLSVLNHLWIHQNNLHGQIPNELGNLLNLQDLQLAENNLKGELPEAILNISSLQILDVAANHLSGELPSHIDLLLPNLEGLYIGGNEFSGKIPNSISNISGLFKLDLSNNFFSGFLPIELGKLRLLQLLSLEVNQLTSEPSNPELSLIHSLTNCKFLKHMWIGYNPLNAMLPISFSNLSNSLTSIDMTSSQIKGSIPEGIGNLTNLIDLHLGDNDFTGFIPTTIGQLRKIQQLHLENSGLHGSLPSSICKLANLGELSLSKNNISGSILSCIGNVTFLEYLNLESNALTSRIPSSLWSLKNLLVLNLSSNLLKSNLSQEIGNLKTITKLDVSKNQLSGNIPSTIGQLQNLVVLSLSENKFEGLIPQTFGDIVSLESLNLSSNNLFGEIPSSLESLKYLKYLNLSFNKLRGAIPEGGPFANFTAESFMSNDALCGAPQFHVRPCVIKRNTDSGKRKMLIFKYTLPIVAATVIVLTSAALWVKYKNKKSNSSIQADSSLPTALKRISYYELLRATNYFDEEFLIGKGGLGEVYKGVLSDGLVIAVKVFNLELRNAFKSFDAECEVMRNIRHRNLVKVISICSNEDFKALLVEYMPNGSLERWLYSHNYFLDMLQRLNIMIDVSSAMEYLHHGYSTPIVHCDLKPSNVLLDEDMVAHVGDFGIAKLLTENEGMVQTKTLGTIGYMSPEHGSEGLVSTMGDVYSYGIMLLEAFTRKKPTDEMFAGELNLKNWVESLIGAVIEVVDTNLLRIEDEHFDVKENCISSIMTVALECTREASDERISMKDVVARLKKIRSKAVDAMNTSTRAPRSYERYGQCSTHQY